MRNWMKVALGVLAVAGVSESHLFGERQLLNKSSGFGGDGLDDCDDAFGVSGHYCKCGMKELRKKYRGATQVDHDCHAAPEGSDCSQYTCRYEWFGRQYTKPCVRND